MSTSEDRTSGASGMAEQQAAGLLGGELREGYAEIGDVRLHYVEAGDGPLVVLLHVTILPEACHSCPDLTRAPPISHALPL